MVKKFSLVLSTTIALFMLNGCGGDSKKTSLETKSTTVNKYPIAIAIASEINTTIGKSINFSAANSSDSDGTIISYTWTDKDGKLLSNEANFNRLFNKDGKYKTTLSITDDRGGASTDTITVKITKNNTSPNTSDEPPVASGTASATDINSGENVHFADDGSYDPEGSELTYEWRDMDGILLSTSRTLDRELYYRPQHDTGNGTTRYVKTLYVRDAQGNVSSVDFEVFAHKSLQNQAPTVDLGEDKSILVGTSATLRADANDPDGVIDSYVWKKGSTIVSGPSYASTYSTGDLPIGTHEFTVIVTDNDGQETTDIVTIVVNATGAGF